ncbi:MAG: methylmalonyl Co-A mutase-associated GTPase MeaB [Jatrophihabitantaceae bacterium]
MAPGRGPIELADLVEQARQGQPRALGRLISLVEDESPALAELAGRLAPLAGHAQVVGITGPPGVGKSTTTSALIAALRATGRRVGVLAVDPSSPFSGGALLGDRIRMTEHATDSGVFIRSMATRGQLGGLAAAAPQALRVLDVAGFDVVLLETVGVGQSEIDVVRLADTTLVLLAPGMGDGIQAVKAGILEIADVFVVNKADRDDAGTVSRNLRHLQAMAGADGASGGGWTVPILRTVATRSEGIDELVRAIERHRSWLAGSGELDRRRQARARAEIEAIAIEQLRRRFRDGADGPTLDELAGRVLDGSLDPYRAVEQLLGD